MTPPTIFSKFRPPYHFRWLPTIFDYPLPFSQISTPTIFVDPLPFYPILTHLLFYAVDSIFYQFENHLSWQIPSFTNEELRMYDIRAKYNQKIPQIQYF